MVASSSPTSPRWGLLAACSAGPAQDSSEGVLLRTRLGYRPPYALPERQGATGALRATNILRDHRLCGRSASLKTMRVVVTGAAGFIGSTSSMR